MELNKKNRIMNLSKESTKIYDEISTAYSIQDPAGVLILQTACESFDLMRLAQKSVRKFGVVITDERNRPKQIQLVQLNEMQELHFYRR